MADIANSIVTKAAYFKIWVLSGAVEREKRGNWDSHFPSILQSSVPA
jgi:hypothetical protein